MKNKGKIRKKVREKEKNAVYLSQFSVVCLILAKKAFMIKKIFAFLCLICGLSMAVMAQNMTDQQVIDYSKQQMAAGVSEREIATQLLRRGVTMEQLNRIKNRMNLENNQNINNVQNRNNQQNNQNTIRRQVNGQENTNQQRTSYPNNPQNRNQGNILGNQEILEVKGILEIKGICQKGSLAKTFIIILSILKWIVSMGTAFSRTLI